MRSPASEDEIPPSRKRKSKRQRKRRRDAGKNRLNRRDRFALPWIGQQYAIRLDHLQWLLGRAPGHGAKHPNWISESAACEVVDRWERMGYVRVANCQPNQPFWIWLSRKGLRKFGLPYVYHDLEESSLDALKHLYAINAIRLQLEATLHVEHWTSERELLRGQVRIKGKHLLHRPDAVVRFADGDIVSVEAELSAKKPFELSEILLELLRGEEYLRAKVEFDIPMARTLCRHEQSQYDMIWYFAPTSVRKQVRRERARLLANEVISEEEAKRIYVFWYPLARTHEEIVQEENEDNEDLGLDREDESEDDSNDAERTWYEGEGNEH